MTTAGRGPRGTESTPGGRQLGTLPEADPCTGDWAGGGCYYLCSTTVFDGDLAAARLRR